MSLVIKALGSRPVSTAANWLTRNRLRVLTYHGVPDPIAFAHQMDLIAERYSTVNGPDVIAWLDGLRRLPKYALWITFDDGDPSVIDIALPLMKERELVATAFICPGLVDTTRAQWWDIAAEAVDANVLPPGSVVRLKRVADAARRAELAEAAAELTKLGRPVTRRQWSQADVDSWVAAGNEIGNHTWD
ncbi:MAG TPA: polysaccharide deacetylase family protein, partial [Ilumatobacteraceae bacterium]|nr:polysaccharide deacetylase family protein [Ilumatobacteraceae bacterium]